MIDKYPALKKIFDFLKSAGRAVADVFEAMWKIIEPIIDGFKWVWNKVKSWFGGDSTVTIEENVTPKYSPNTSGVSSGLQLSPLAGSQAQIATMGGMSQSADINVRFDNMPPMTRIETITNDTNLDLEIYRGVNGGTIQ